MPDYSFLNLSPPEFEDLTRDLLQKHLKTTLESFTSGRDNGIDLRYSMTKSKQLIVQCKRYQNYNSLIKDLKKEVPKVQTLQPTQYILATTVGLTPGQKDEIITLFSPFIKLSGDIYGRDDLNNLLGLFPKIEQQHFKLWLASTNILDRILNNKIYNQSNFETEAIQSTIDVYVDNDSYYQATKIIKEKKYVIISGIPGIGKTTLARILAYNYLAKGFEEFIYLSDSVSEGFTAFKEGVKQIFMFDDFLGTNFLENKLANNEDQKLVKFIEKISKAEDKIIILTTREYILAQAKQKYFALNSPSLEIAKCIIDLSQYTRLVRAKILYNHLFFSNLSKKHLANLLRDKGYQKVIDHPNYNPRIIETITNDDVWSSIEPKHFTERFLEFIKNPTSVWEHVYDNQISRLSQCILANLMTAGTPVLFEDLKLMTQFFAKDHASKYGIIYSEIEFKKSIKELENTFIKTYYHKENNLFIEYQNPSVQDFLVFHFRELPDFVSDLIYSAQYFNQLFRIFSFNEDFDFAIENRILFNEDQCALAIKRIIDNFDLLRTSVINIYSSSKDKKLFSNYTKLKDICTAVSCHKHNQLKHFLIQRFEMIMYPNNSELWHDEIKAYIYVAEELKPYIIIDLRRVLFHLSESIIDIHDFKEIENFGRSISEEYFKIMSNDRKHRNRIETLLEIETENVDMDDWESGLEEIVEMARQYGINFENFERDIKKRAEQHKTKNKKAYAWDKEKIEHPFSKNEADDQTIRNLFDSLRVN